jgi:hypothetical protein
VAAVLLDLLSNPASAQTQTLYGYCGVGIPSRLITINPTTAAGSLVATSPYRSPGLAFRGGKLYIFDDASLKMVELDPATGAGINIIDIGTVPFNNEGDIAFRSDGIGFMSSWPAGTPLRRFDVSAGTSTVIGPLSLVFDGLAFNAAGVLYGLAEGGAQLYTIDPTTAATTLVGNTGIPAGGFFNGALAFDASGNLYAAVAVWPPTSSSVLYRIDTATGAATLIGNIGFGSVVGLAFGSPAPPPPPPTPPAPPPQPHGDEGSYPGCTALGGPEGSFGLGGRGLRSAKPSGANFLSTPVLLGPLRMAATATDPADAMALAVFNVSHRRPPELRQTSPGITIAFAVVIAFGAIVAGVGAKIRSRRRFVRPGSQGDFHAT